jgi:hypothetical protein
MGRAVLTSADPIRLDLGRSVMFQIYGPAVGVCTCYPDGFRSHATRDDTDDNRREAADQGYAGPDAVWWSLVEHELLHTLAARVFFRRESLVLRHEAGAECNAYALRLHEEAVVISLQRWIRRGVVDPVLRPALRA